jgi:macrolide transport system ATP-binding/permease protein
MKWTRVWGLRLAGLWRAEERNREVAAELEAHLQLHVDDNLRAGMTPEQARREAVLKLGGVESTKQVCRERNGVPVIDNLLLDARFAVRQLQKNPGFTCTAVLMLALGMCASVAIFAFVDACLIKPLPYRDSARLVGVFEAVPMFPLSNLSYPDYLDWKKLNTAFKSLDIFGNAGYSVSTPAGLEPTHGTRVSDGFFRTLGVAPVLGRDFRTGEDLPSAPRTVMLSYGAWQKRYGGKQDVLGQAVILSGNPYIVIGVLPAAFYFAPTEPTEFWTAYHAENECDLRRSCHSIYGIARLKDGVTFETALANVKLIAKQLETQYPEHKGQGAAVIALSEVIIGRLRPILLVLLSGAGLLLLIAGVNAASLLLVRSEGRKREIAVRSALGAGRARLICQFATEGLILALAGSVLGLVAAVWTMKLLTGLIAANMLASMPYLQGLGLNIRVTAFASGIALLAALLFSAAPALHFALPGMMKGMGEGSRGSSGNSWRRLGSKLVVVELATAVVLLAGAGLLGKSLYLLLQVRNGLQPDHLATLSVAAPKARYAKDEQLVALQRQILSGIENLPGVTSAGITTQLPITSNGNTDWIRFVGRPYNGEHNEVNERDVSAGYLPTLEAKLLRGRYFAETEDASKPKVAIINQALARKYFAGQDPIGKQIGDLGLSPKSIKEIIGVVDDIREGSLDSEIWPAVYYPFAQSPNDYFQMVVRTSQAEMSLIPALNAVIHRLDPTIVAFGGGSLREEIRNSQSAYLHRTTAWLVGGFAALALLLGVVGLYGVVAYSVSQRTREIGVRMALGAERGSVYSLILREAGWLALAGIVLGLAASIGTANLMGGLLFGVKSWDVPTLGCVAALLAISAIVASFIPARRAAAVNPVEALRVE